MFNLDPLLVPLIPCNMKRFFLPSLILFFITTVEAQLGWTTLFDGKSLDGWKKQGGKAQFEIYRGVIAGISVPNSPNSFLCTETEYGDFDLEVEVMITDTNSNSGIQFRSHYDP